MMASHAMLARTEETPMPAHRSKAVTMIVTLSFLALLSGAASAEGPQAGATVTCDPGATARLTIVNQCADAIWTVITAPGSPNQIAVREQWDWVNPYVTKENTINTGGTGSISAATPTTLTVGTQPNPALVVGMKIKIIGAASGGNDLTTTITGVSSNLLNLKNTGTPVTDAQLLLYDGTKAFQIGAGVTQDLCVPDKGAPSGNFRFFMGCPSLINDTDPFNTSTGCIIGSSFGDAAGVNTLFEPSFGCIPPLAGSQCAFNASSEAQFFPKCAADPNGTNCGPLTSTDFFDVSAVDGYTFAMRVDSTPPTNGTCSAPFKDASMLDLASCPTETVHTLYSSDPDQQTLIKNGIELLTQDAQHLKSCAAPYKWFASTKLGNPPNPTLTNSSCTNGTCTSVSYYAAEGCDNATCKQGTCPACPAGSGPQQKVGPKSDGTFAIQNTNFVQQLRALGYTGYTWQYDDGVGSQTCNAGAKMTVTLCPTGSSPTPYLQKPLWKYSKSTATCSTDGKSSGTPDGMTTFGSLFECQSKNMLYTCTDLTDFDPFNLPIGVWAANPDFTLLEEAGKEIFGPGFTIFPYGKTYDHVLNSQVLVCQPTGNLTIKASKEFNPPGGEATFNLTNCTYYGGRRADNSVCPK